MKKALFSALVLVALAAAAVPGDARFHGGIGTGSAVTSGLPATLTVYNNSGSTLTGATVKYDQPFATGDVTSGQKVQLYESDGTTPITTQEDGCGTWAQDGSRRHCILAFTHNLSSGANTFKINVVSGAPNTTAKVTVANITANTSIVLKSSDLTENNGTAEAGTWDFIDVNYVLNNCAQWNSSTGYGSNPKCGWRIIATGQGRFGLALFQYAHRESDGAWHDWLRTDLWLDAWGSGSTPCPCSVGLRIGQPNAHGALSGATVGSSPEGGYIFSTTLYNGANTIYSWGGASDDRYSAALTSTNFTPTTYSVTWPTGNGFNNTYGIFPVIFTGASLPTGMTSGAIVWTSAQAPLINGIQQLFPNQCAVTQGYNGACNYIENISTTSANTTVPAEGSAMRVWNQTGATIYVKMCPTSSCTATTSDTAISSNGSVYLFKGTNAYIAYICPAGTGQFLIIPMVGFSDQGSGSITVTPYAYTTPYVDMDLKDNAGNRLWIGSGGTASAAPQVNVGQDFTYLTQKTKAMPPYITSLAGNLMAYPAGAPSYYPGIFGFFYNINTTGDGVGDERIGWNTHTCTYALFMPNDQIAQTNCMVQAAGFEREHMHIYDETAGVPVVWNNGHNKDGVTYAGMGAVQPDARMMPYQSGGSPAWAYPSTALVDIDPIYEAYTEWMEPSHMPMPGQTPFLKTGDEEWQTQMLDEAGAMDGLQANSNPAQTGGITYYRPQPWLNNQTRGAGWAMRILAQADFFNSTQNPTYQYRHDILLDNMNLQTAWYASNATAPWQAAGVYWPDVQNGRTNTQPWAIDFLFAPMAVLEWRGENPSYNWTSSYLAKNAIGRMDPSLGIGGCLWAGPGRNLNPWSGAWGSSTYYTQWSDVYTRTTQVFSEWSSQLPGGTWSCPANGMYADTGSSSAYQPVSLYDFAAESAALGSLLGVSNSTSIYNAIRSMQYSGTTTTPPGCSSCSPALSFINYYEGGGVFGSFPEFAIGPLGATQ